MQQIRAAVSADTACGRQPHTTLAQSAASSSIFGEAGEHQSRHHVETSGCDENNNDELYVQLNNHITAEKPDQAYVWAIFNARQTRTYFLVTTHRLVLFVDFHSL